MQERPAEEYGLEVLIFYSFIFMHINVNAYIPLRNTHIAFYSIQRQSLSF